MDDVNFQATISDNINAVIFEAGSEENCSSWYKLGLHVLTKLHKKRLLKVPKGSVESDTKTYIVNDDAKYRLPNTFEKI